VKFVGEGRGDYDVVQESSWWRRCLCWTCCVCLLISLLLAAITASRQFYQHAMDAGMPRYSCYNSDGNLPPPNARMIQTWSVPHRIWCCDNVGVGCETSTSLTTTPVPTTWIMVPVPDFHEGFLAPHAQAAQGGPPVVPFAMQFHCHVGIPDTWSSTQKAFCCERVQIGCPTPQPPPVPPEPDCVVSSGNNPLTWPPVKQAWCCEHHQTGCIKDSGFHCDEGDASAWAQDKRAYCCTAAGLGCTTQMPLEGQMFDCTEGYANWPEWPVNKQSWCCEHHSRACPSEDKQQYDCSTSESSWISEQREWCCLHHGKACAE